jgi:ubiquinone biosynthesis protein UbiJ
MTEAVSEFFEGLAQSGHAALPSRANGVMRLEIVKGKRIERWLVALEKGKVDVSHGNGPADCVVRGDRELLNRISTGEVNAFAATLRGALAVQGDPRLLVLFQRLFPGPPSTRPAPRPGDYRQRRR